VWAVVYKVESECVWGEVEISSTPACNITVNNDLLVEQDETFSLTASIQNSNGQSVQFSASGDSASTTITDDDGMLA